MKNYQIIQLGAFAVVVEDAFTGNRSRTVKSRKEAEIELTGLCIRNLMHS